MLKPIKLKAPEGYRWRERTADGIDLTQKQSRYLHEEAARRGVSVETLLQQMLEEVCREQPDDDNPPDGSR